MSGTVSKKNHRSTAPRSAWRKDQKKVDAKKQISVGLLALGLILGLIILSRLISFVGGFGQPYHPDSPGEVKQSVWDGSSELNLAIKADTVYLLSFDPEEKIITAAKIPETTYLNLPMGYGRWPVRSIYSLGQAESPAMGAKLLQESLTYSLGIPVDGYLILADKYSKDPFDKTLEAIRQNPITAIQIFNDSKTNLSFVEIMKLIFEVRSVRFDKTHVVDLGQSSITEWLLLPDGTRALQMDQAKLDLFIQKNFADNQLVKEGLTIGVFNSTDHPGLAERAARLIGNMGGRVIMTSNISDHLQNSVVLGKRSYTYSRLSRIFSGCDNSKSSLECAKITSNDFQRVDIALVLGEDYYLRFNGR